VCEVSLFAATSTAQRISFHFSTAKQETGFIGNLSMRKRASTSIPGIKSRATRSGTGISSGSSRRRSRTRCRKGARIFRLVRLSRAMKSTTCTLIGPITSPRTNRPARRCISDCEKPWVRLALRRWLAVLFRRPSRVAPLVRRSPFFRGSPGSLSMNGFGRRPRPSAIAAMVRPDATDGSSSRSASASPSHAASSRRLINSQSTRFARMLPRLRRTSTQPPFSRLPDRLKLSSPGQAPGAAPRRRTAPIAAVP
jgi:hypothetical protein